MAQCPGWHGLKKFSTTHRGFTCDSCSKSQSWGCQMWGCRICDYDLCSSCYSNQNNIKKGSSSKIQSLFEKHYGDPDDPDVMSQSGMIKFFKDCGVNPEGYETLIIAYFFRAAEMGIYEKEEFIKGLVDAGCSTKKEIKKAVQDRIKLVQNNDGEYKRFYKWLFQHVREDDKKRSIPTELATQLWSLVLQPKRDSMRLLDQWLAFCAENQEKDLRVISKDVWEQMYDFLVETQQIDDNYDDAGGAWPVVVDEFVEWIQEQQQKK